MTKFKELCVDSAGSGTELGRFWAAVTGCAYVEPSSARSHPVVEEGRQARLETW